MIADAERMLPDDFTMDEYAARFPEVVAAMNPVAAKTFMHAFGKLTLGQYNRITKPDRDLMMNAAYREWNAAEKRDA